jgi:GcrA cell cycle regulator
MTFWNTENTANLKKWWGAGMTAGQISDAFDKKISRNAVIGKAHRLGLQGRPSPIHRNIKYTQGKIKLTRAVDLPLATTYAEIPKQCCQYPYVGEQWRDTIGWCGRPVFKDKPWCESCCDKIYTNKDWRKKYDVLE